MSKLFFSSPTLKKVDVYTALESVNLPTFGVDIQNNQVCYTLPEAFTLSKQALNEHLQPISSLYEFDFAVLDAEFTHSEFKLLAMDMDSTLITIECIDEIADYAGKKKEVSEITEAAMRGEITDFSESLTKRVALLQGVPETALEAVYNERLKLSEGAEKLIAYAKYCGWKTLLVSGGFTYFTEKLKNRLKLDYAYANTLEIVDGHLTGKVLGPIVDGQAKKNALLSTCAEMGFESKQAIAMGDGANDLLMMNVAGASVAFRAKPKVQEQTDYRINFGGLDSVAKWFEANA